MQQCSFCGTAIDAAAAEKSAAETSKISQACSDASYLRIMFRLMLPSFGLIFVPLLSLLGGVGLLFLEVAIPIMCIRWWVKYRRIQTRDPDFSKARGNAILVSCLIFVADISLRFHIGHT